MRRITEASAKILISAIESHLLGLKKEASTIKQFNEIRLIRRALGDLKKEKKVFTKPCRK